MKRRRVILIAAGCLVAVVVAFVVWPGEREPEYQGKKLSEWIDGASETAIVVPDLREREEAVRRIGTNAVPFLLKWIAATEVPQRSKIQLFVTSVSESVGLKLWRIRVRKWQRGTDSAWAFRVLGNNARAALPELIKLSHSTNFWEALNARAASGYYESVREVPSNQVGTSSSRRN